MKKLFVGNLDSDATEDELRQLFASYGPVEKVDIIKDRDTGKPRGFGFVEMANTSDADNAITGVNGALLGGRSLHIMKPIADQSVLKGVDSGTEAVGAGKTRGS